MNKRILATFLWFNVGWTAGAMGSFFLGFPEGLNIVLAGVLAAVMWFDPAHLIWASETERRVRRPDDLIVEPKLPAGDPASR